MAQALETLSRHACFGGEVSFHRHVSRETRSAMRFAVYAPPQARQRRVPVLYWLSGLTCSEETFMIKSGAQRVAAELGLMLVTPDTSPRGVDLPGDRDDWDFGIAAGFYLDATQAPWSAHYRMYSYVVEELPQLLASHFPAADVARCGIFGHSMGGHGALIIGLRNLQRYRSISAFAPIAAPSRAPWGRKAFAGYLGTDQQQWHAHDASEIARRMPDAAAVPELLVDQGLADPYLDPQLMVDAFESACAERGIALQLRRHAGYDHGYYFISSFIADHLRLHAQRLASG